MKIGTSFTQCDCIWCGGTMYRSSKDYMHKDLKHFTLWCKDCGAVVIHAKNTGYGISGFSIKFDTDDNENIKITGYCNE